MAIAAATISPSTSSRALLNASGSCFVNSINTTISSRSRVECCATSPSNSQVAATMTGSSLRCPASAPVSSRVVLPPHMIPIPVVEVDEDEEDELTFIEDYGDGRRNPKKSTTWLTSQYLSLRLRCSSLMAKEASDALGRHFKGREPNGLSVKFMINTDTVPTEPEKKSSRHHRRNLISESYHGDTVKFIEAVILSDNQGEYFEGELSRTPLPN